MHGLVGGWNMGGMSFLWLLAVVLIVAYVWWSARRGGRQDPAQESPEGILKRRYARGEIDREEYERRLSDLRR
jgi:putative membrane protein